LIETGDGTRGESVEDPIHTESSSAQARKSQRRCGKEEKGRKSRCASRSEVDDVGWEEEEEEKTGE
jgi:hypothetical protein